LHPTGSGGYFPSLLPCTGRYFMCLSNALGIGANHGSLNLASHHSKHTAQYINSGCAWWRWGWGGAWGVGLRCVMCTTCQDLTLNISSVMGSRGARRSGFENLQHCWYVWVACVQGGNKWSCFGWLLLLLLLLLLCLFVCCCCTGSASVLCDAQGL
jgi:hypothetical protein